jgi:hypothetical protein
MSSLQAYIKSTNNFTTMSIRQEPEFDLATTIKGAGYYRRSRKTDFVSDYLPPNPDELKKVLDNDR